ncbi:MAG TPA: MFS transporter [Solirubrobacteraceae bacterium]|jgi:EmrB/QacA subfamily drug resistance transporter|nr:MFS transporter [Solirubrobacteraceae bacterium]
MGHPRRRQILGVLCLALLIVVIDNTILNTALPTLARKLHATTTDLQWITDAYTLTFAALLVFAGALGDRFGRRRALLAGLTIFGAGSAAAGLSSSAGELIAFRAVMGIGGAFVMPATLSIINTVFPPRERAQAIAAWSAVAGVAIVLGPTLGGLLLNHFAWSSVFFVNVPLVAIALLAVGAAVPGPPVAERLGRLDIPGAVLSGLAMLAAIDAVIEAPNQGWTSARTLGELGLAAVLMAGFVVRELRTQHPLIDVRVFTHRAFSAATSAVGLTFLAMFGSLFALTQYLQLVHGFSPLGAGLRALPFGFAVMVTAPSSSLLVRRFGIRIVIPAGLLSMAAGLFVLTSLTATTGLAHLSIGTALMGAGMGLVLAPASESMMSVLPVQQSGVGSAVNDTIQEFGGSLGVAVIGSIVSAVYSTQMHSSQLPAAVLHHASSSIAAAYVTAAHAPALADPILTAAHAAFTDAMTTGFTVAGAVAAIAALGLTFVLPRRVVTKSESAPGLAAITAA